MIRQIQESIIDADIVSLNEITEIENEVRTTVRKILNKHDKSHLVKPTGYIQVSIRTSKDTLAGGSS